MISNLRFFYFDGRVKQTFRLENLDRIFSK